jgi:hypothetical protein
VRYILGREVDGHGANDVYDCIGTFESATDPLSANT